MAHDVFEVYKVIVEDTNQISARRQTVDTVYVSIVTLVLAADGYVAATSQYSNWLSVIATFGVSIVGIIFANHWRRVLDDLKTVLRLRYEYLRRMEMDESMMQIGAQIYTEEDLKIYQSRESEKQRQSFGFGGRTRSLQFIFTIVFVVIPLIQLALTALVTLPAFHLVIAPLLSPSGK